MKANIKQACRAVSDKATSAVIVGSALLATNSFAGPLAEAVKAETSDFKTDLYAVGGVVIGLAMVGVGVAMVVRMMRRA